MRIVKHTVLAAAVLTALLASAHGQTTADSAPASLPAEVTAAHSQVVRDLATLIGNDVAALKTAVATLEVNRAAGVPDSSNAANVEAARAQLRTDQQALADAAKAFFKAVRLAVKTDRAEKAEQAQFEAEMTSALNTEAIASGKTAVDAAEAKVKADIAANDMVALSIDKAARHAAIRQLVADRSAALAVSQAVAANRAAREGQLAKLAD
jgi:ribosomal 50S subunit-recycling heat shock protein